MTESRSNETFELLSLREIFGNGERRFKIPDYQRGYSWERRQRKDLIEDLEELLQHERNHYTGTIVATQPVNGDGNLFQVVDGQQRLTTLVLLISVINRNLKEMGTAIPPNLSDIDLEEIFIATGRDEGHTKFKLVLNGEQNELFCDLLEHGEPRNKFPKTKSDVNLENAIDEFKDWVKDLSIDQLIKLPEVISNSLGFLFYAPKNDSEIGIMFEVINNRGKPLSELEKIKNYLIYFAEKNCVLDLKKKVNNAWGNILENLNKAKFTSNEDEDSFLRNCWIVFKDCSKKNSHRVYDKMKEEWKPEACESWQEMIRFVEFLEKASHTYVLLWHREGAASYGEKKWLKRIALHSSNASVLPLILALYEKENEIDSREKVLEVIEKLNFRYYVSGIANRNDSSQGELFERAFKYYHHYGKEVETVRINSDWLKRELVAFVSNNANDQKFVQNLTLDKDEAGDYYNWQGLKFFLASYEEDLRKKKGESLPTLEEMLAKRDLKSPNNFFHREHIWAIKDYKIIKDEDDRNVNKRRLGNFILLKETQNIKVSNKRPERKVSLYWEDRENDPNTLMIRELKGWFNKAREEVKAERMKKRNSSRVNKTHVFWFEVYQKFFDIREQKLVNFALYRWRVDGVSKPVEKVMIDSFRDTNEIYKCEPQYAPEIRDEG